MKCPKCGCCASATVEKAIIVGTDINLILKCNSCSESWEKIVKLAEIVQCLIKSNILDNIV